MQVGHTKHRMAVWEHACGVFAVVWGLLAWAEWFITPLLMPNAGGPVPYAVFSPLVAALWFGCLWLALMTILLPSRIASCHRYAYAAVPASYAAYQICRGIL